MRDKERNLIARKIAESLFLEGINEERKIIMGLDNKMMKIRIDTHASFALACGFQFADIVEKNPYRG